MKWLYKALMLFVFSSQAFASMPETVQAGYEVFMSGTKVGKIDETYSKNGDHYTLSSVTTPLGLLAMFKPEKIYITSRGLITKQGLKPLYFEDKREGNPGKSSQAEFNWTAQQLTLIHQTVRTPLALPEGTQDRLSAMYQFMFINLKDMDMLNFAMTNGNKLDTYHYAIGAREKLDTPAGQLDSIYLDSQAKPGESRTEIWLSTEYKLPCKMIITEANGNQYTQLLSTLKILP
jgi:hypothetical protein